MTTYRISTPDNPGHSTGLDLDQAVNFAIAFGYDESTARVSLKAEGRFTMRDDVGEIVLEAEEPV